MVTLKVSTLVSARDSAGGRHIGDDWSLVLVVAAHASNDGKYELEIKLRSLAEQSLSLAKYRGP